MQARSASKDNDRIPCLRCGLSCCRQENLSHPSLSRTCTGDGRAGASLRMAFQIFRENVAFDATIVFPVVCECCKLIL
jgi:hypothetical protein